MKLLLYLGANTNAIKGSIKAVVLQGINENILPEDHVVK
jgi:hypothetical protein